jgi:hypothetical protein
VNEYDDQWQFAAMIGANKVANRSEPSSVKRAFFGEVSLVLEGITAQLVDRQRDIDIV